MIVKTDFFDSFVATAKAGDIPTTPKVGRSFSVKGHSLHAELSLIADAKALKTLSRLERADVRFFDPRNPARRIAGPFCLLPLLVNNRLVDIFCAEVYGGMVALAIYSDEPLAAFKLIDEVWEAAKV
ncbi:hypothetical protein Q5H93_06310 [Hymenobacter sp. ASUV-10]|uniref:Uncharacterized protein n=1 Tax=Hymenobacter aranciens TaxID=3063996 RepID=A0ABT9B7T3_9BACT|nr:hypothetical protein [Hymenobacter sp. ASUV-10]MDO7874339.1 hypothetical protein [Hymenobacter sp. ASUV-10]